MATKQKSDLDFTKIMSNPSLCFDFLPLLCHSDPLRLFNRQAEIVRPASTSPEDFRPSFHSTRIRTTAYHTEANGLVERFHRQIKSAIIATSGLNLAERLPIILLSIRNTINENLGYCPTELVYGTTLGLPGEMIFDSQDLHISKELTTCSFVFVRVDTVKKPLQPPYEDLEVFKHKPKYFTLDSNGTKDPTNIDRLKPAYLDPQPNQHPLLEHLSCFTPHHQKIMDALLPRHYSPLPQILRTL
nr:pol polyprotein [Hymenolepis microstoma]